MKRITKKEFNQAVKDGLLDREDESLASRYKHILKLVEYCRAKFGKAPEIPSLEKLIELRKARKSAIGSGE